MIALSVSVLEPHERWEPYGKEALLDGALWEACPMGGEPCGRRAPWEGSPMGGESYGRGAPSFVSSKFEPKSTFGSTGSIIGIGA